MAGPSNVIKDDYTLSLQLQLEEAGTVMSLTDLLSIAPERWNISTEMAGDIELAHRLHQEELKNATAFGVGTIDQRLQQEVLPGAVFKCPICFEFAPHATGLSLGQCNHRFCSVCLRSYLSNLAKDRSVVPVKCPSCPGKLDPEQCLLALHGTDAYNIFAKLVTEHVHHSELRYCISEQCGIAFDAQNAVNYRADCPKCTTAICTRCRSAWHEQRTCEQERAIRLDMNAVGRLAHEKNWMTCPNCMRLVEKSTDSCNHVTCVCGTSFCFNCGKAYKNSQRNMNNVHGRAGCQCGLFANDRRQQAIQERLPIAIQAANAIPNNSAQLAGNHRIAENGGAIVAPRAYPRREFD